MLQHFSERSRRAWWWCVPVLLLIGVMAPVQLIAERKPVTPTVLTSSVGVPDQPLAVLQRVPVTPTVMATSIVRQEDNRDMYKRWVFLRSDDASSMNGSTEDFRRAKTFQKHPGDRLIWFRKGSEEYVIRDSAILAAVEEAYRPLDKLGDEQARLGEQQGQLGKQQGTLGYKQSVHGGEQAKLAGKQAEISARLQEAMTKQARAAAYARERSGTTASAAQQRNAERLIEELTREQEAVSRQQDALGRQQEELGREQEALGQKQAELGSIQEELGRKQEEAARQAHGVLIEIMKNAITSGSAQKVR